MSLQIGAIEPLPTVIKGDCVRRTVGRASRDWGTVQRTSGPLALVYWTASGRRTWVSMGALERVTPERERP